VDTEFTYTDLDTKIIENHHYCLGYDVIDTTYIFPVSVTTNLKISFDEDETDLSGNVLQLRSQVADNLSVYEASGSGRRT